MKRWDAMRSLWMIAVRVAVPVISAVPVTGLADEPDGGPPTPAESCGTIDPETGRCWEPENITVVVARRPQPLGSVSRIDAKEISLRGARNVPDALRLEPSVEINQSPKQGSTLQMRGFDERASLLMIEGIPIREVYDGHFDIASLPAYSLGSIEIERGVSTLLDGPNTAGGIISLKAPTTCDDYCDASLFGGQPYGDRLLDYGGRAAACGTGSDFTLHLNTGAEHSDGYVLSHGYSPSTQNAQFHENGGIRDGSDTDRFSMATLAKYAPRPNQSLSLFVDGIRSPRGIPPFEGAGYTRYWRFSRYDTLLTGLSGVYGPDQIPRTWGFREVKGQLYAHVHRDQIDDYQDASYSTPTTNPLAWFVSSAYANETYGGAVQSSWSLNEGNRLDTSLRYNLDLHRQRTLPVPRWSAETDWTPWAHYYAHTFSAAIEDTQALGPWSLLAGIGGSGMSLISQEINNKDYPVDERVLPGAEGRLVAQYQVIDGLSLMAAGGHKVRFPTLKELFSNVVGGNPDLNTERAWMAETGLDCADLPVKDLESSLRIFFNSIEDLIEQYHNVYANVGHAVTTGTEIEVRYKPIDVLQILSGYQYLFAYDMDKERPLDYRTPHRVRLGARIFTGVGLTCALDATYNSGQQSSYLNASGSDWVEDHLPGYFMLNGHVEYEFAVGVMKAVYVYLDGQNLLDANYYQGSFEPRPGLELMTGIGGRI